MLVRELKRLIAILGPLIFVTFLGLKYHSGGSLTVAIPSWDAVKSRISNGVGSSGQDHTSLADGPSGPGPGEVNHNISETHRIVYSVSTPDKRYFPIRWGDYEALNPNIIPHPSLNDTWIVVAQQQRGVVENSVWVAEMVCNAVFKNGALVCDPAPLLLPIASTFGLKCSGDLAWLALNVGPHDARAFYGPKHPYAVYGSNSAVTCFGQFMHDFRLLFDWGYEVFNPADFRMATELQRPAVLGAATSPYNVVEKNWFIFWDTLDYMYVHYDIAPRRSFARLNFDGSVGQDLAPAASASDERCLARYMPKIAPDSESIHQATNSLSITLCKRTDPACEVSESNTFIITIFHHKSYYNFHGVYEPYVMAIRQTAPFEVHGISEKAIWIEGRGLPANERPPGSMPVLEEKRPKNHTEMFYMTSMSWKAKGQKYHGYMDDILFLGFGIEDSSSGGIDIVAGDLMLDLRLCSAV